MNAAATAAVLLSAKVKRAPEYAEALWQRWPAEADWPGILDLYEAAAFLRVDYKSIWRACRVARTDQKSVLPHMRIGASYRIRRSDLGALGRVEGRAA